MVIAMPGAAPVAIPRAAPAQMEETYLDRLLNCKGRVAVDASGKIHFLTDTINQDNITKVQDRAGMILLKEYDAFYKKYFETQGKTIIDAARQLVDRTAVLQQIRNNYLALCNIRGDEWAKNLVKSLNDFEEKISHYKDQSEKLNHNLNAILILDEQEKNSLSREIGDFLKNEKTLYEYLNNTLIKLANDIGEHLAIFDPHDPYSEQLISKYQELYTIAKNIKKTFEEIKQKYKINFQNGFINFITQTSGSLKDYWLHGDHGSKISSLVGFFAPQLLNLPTYIYNFSYDIPFFDSLNKLPIANLVCGAVSYGLDKYLRNRKKTKIDILNISEPEVHAQHIEHQPLPQHQQTIRNITTLAQRRLNELQDHSETISLLNEAYEKLTLNLKKYGRGIFSSSKEFDMQDKFDTLTSINLALIRRISQQAPEGRRGRLYEYDELFNLVQRRGNYLLLRQIQNYIKDYHEYLLQQQYEKQSCQQIIQKHSALPFKTIPFNEKYKTNDIKLYLSNLHKNAEKKHILMKHSFINLDEKTKEFLLDMINYVKKQGFTEYGFLNYVKSLYKSFLSKISFTSDLMEKYKNAYNSII